MTSQRVIFLRLLPALGVELDPKAVDRYLVA